MYADLVRAHVQITAKCFFYENWSTNTARKDLAIRDLLHIETLNLKWYKFKLRHSLSFH
jgi:hypothetical protein